MARTPLPWQFEPHGGFGSLDLDDNPWPFGYISTAPTPTPIFEISPLLVYDDAELMANAELIVKAVNAHDDLVAALRSATDRLEKAFVSIGSDEEFAGIAVAPYRELLAKVGELK